MKSKINWLIILISILAIPAYGQQFKAMVFTKVAGFHHTSVNEGVDALRKLASRNEFSLDWHQNANKFNEENLAKYDVVIFLMTTGDILNEKQQTAFEKFIQSGKGFVGIHTASDTEYDWPWYNQLVGRMFQIHPRKQTAMIKVEDRNFPGMQLMPDSRWWTDEWYQFGEEKANNLNYLVTVDESTYDAKTKRGGNVNEGMGDFHPISWYHDHDGGRSFYTAMGHIASTYEDAIFLEHIYGGIFWAATGKGVITESK